MPPVTLLLGVHNHQPVGNFGHVFRDAYERCYRPFLDVLERHPSIRMTLHYTGPLLDWFEKEEPGFLDRLAKLVQANQVEMLGGGFYEPILAVIPDRDAVSQLNLLAQRLRDRIGAHPQGFWLAERVWDGALPKKVAPARVRYTILDDTHFLYAGVDPESLQGYYVTEREGHTLALYPISKALRYVIPFRVPEALIEFMGRLRDGAGGAITYADDGEKFGLWPETYKWVYEERYLERLFTALEENHHWIRLMTFTEHLEAHPPTGRIYLPSASYEEMMDWALPTEAAKALQDRRAELNREGRLAEFCRFFRGGLWEGFFVKYPESNHLHKRMLDVSRRVAERRPSDPKLASCAEHVWRAQGNDVYWHGLFGGLYLSHLRHEAYRNLIAAELQLEVAAHEGREEWLEARVTDFDGDGHEEVLISTRTLGVCIAPAYGGSVLELDYRPSLFNVSNVLARREEAYHRELKNAALHQEGGGGPPQSIHDVVKVKEAGLEHALHYDRYRRVSFLERLLPAPTSWEAFNRIDEAERASGFPGRYAVESGGPILKDGELHLSMIRKDTVELQGQRIEVQLRKRYGMTENDPALAVAYVLEHEAHEPAGLRFGVELNVTLLAGDDPLRYYEWPGSGHVRLRERGACEDCEQFSLVDEWHRFRLSVHLDRAGDVWYAPIETVSQSEEGFERTYQGSALLVSWRTVLQPRLPERFGLRLAFSEI